jgi:hypothetical protein
VSAYHIVNGMGDSLESPTAEQMLDFLRQVDWSDREHGAAWASDEYGNSLELDSDGILVFSTGDDPVRHIPGCTHEKAVALWNLLAKGEIDLLEREAWEPGNCPPELAASRRQASEAALVQLDRNFYLSLGAESETSLCSTPNCGRGRVFLSVSCRVHHFENIFNRPCPFLD